jgi:hypothetical protein
MNLTKLGFSGWIIVLNVLLLILLLVQLHKTSQYSGVMDTFVNIPQQVNPEAPVKQDPAIDTANMNYTALLAFIKENPLKSGRFIQDIRSKFFADNCPVRDYIDFNNIITLPNGPIFT